MRKLLALILLVALGIGNFMAYNYATVITNFLCGTGEDFSDAKLTLKESDALCQTIGDSLAVCFMVEVDGEIDEVGNRFPVTVETFFFYLTDSGAGSAHGGSVELQQSQGLFNIFVCHCSRNIELL